MLEFNFLQICILRGISSPYSFLKNAGFTHFVAYKIVNQKYKEIRITDLYLLCDLLFCTPNDLFNFIPKNQPAEHPLHSLVKEKLDFDYSKELLQIPLDEIINVQSSIKSKQHPEK